MNTNLEFANSLFSELKAEFDSCTLLKFSPGSNRNPKLVDGLYYEHRQLKSTWVLSVYRNVKTVGNDIEIAVHPSRLALPLDDPGLVHRWLEAQKKRMQHLESGIHTYQPADAFRIGLKYDVALKFAALLRAEMEKEVGRWQVVDQVIPGISAEVASLSNIHCEAWIGNKWCVVPVELLLAYPKITRRCVECQGPVRLHKAGPNGKWPAHAENYPRHDGCSLGHTFDGNRLPNPYPVTSPIGVDDIAPILPEELLAPSEFIEGAAVSVSVNAYERNPKARAACLKHYGFTCVVCDFNFKQNYGSSASHIIHVHHLTPLHSIRAQYVVDPIKDLRPVCPNCHAVIHSKSIPLSIEDVKAMLVDRRDRC